VFIVFHNYLVNIVEGIYVNEMSSKRGGDMEKAGDGLNLKQRAFVREYLVDRNGTQAAIRAGYSAHTAQEQSSVLLSKLIIKELIVEQEQRLAALADVDAALVISELREVALADPRDLVSLHRGACRYCHGIEHDYQWTQGEYRNEMHKAQADNPNAPAPPFRGGLGYDFTREPAGDCPECRGFGTERVFVKDTRKLSRGAAKLIASIKQTRDGSIELKHRDQDGALLALGKVCGIFVDRQEHSGPGGGPLQLQPVQAIEQLSNHQLEEILRRSGRLLEGRQPSKELTEGATTNDNPR
jgi:phage terminase small subunit